MLAGRKLALLHRALWRKTFGAFEKKLFLFTATKLTNRPNITCHIKCLDLLVNVIQDELFSAGAACSCKKIPVGVVFQDDICIKK
jgi:hypothetical protein